MKWVGRMRKRKRKRAKDIFKELSVLIIDQVRNGKKDRLGDGKKNREKRTI